MTFNIKRYLGAASEPSNILVIGDGFTTVEQEQFDGCMTEIAEAIRSQPWHRRAPKLGLWGLLYATDEPNASPVQVVFGAACAAPPGGPFLTRLSAQYGMGNACQMLTGAEGRADDLPGLLMAAGVMPNGFTGFDGIMVLLNCPLYGGSHSGLVAWASTTPGLFPRLALHEMGHITGLHDEYEGNCGKPLPVGTWWNHNNVAKSKETAQWRHWIGSTFALLEKTNPGDEVKCDLPTRWPPRMLGFFEGAAKAHKGHYRPAHQCRMRNNASAFCSMCDMHIAKWLDPANAGLDSAFA